MHSGAEGGQEATCVQLLWCTQQLTTSWEGTGRKAGFGPTAALRRRSSTLLLLSLLGFARRRRRSRCPQLPFGAALLEPHTASTPLSARRAPSPGQVTEQAAETAQGHHILLKELRKPPAGGPATSLPFTHNFKNSSKP